MENKGKIYLIPTTLGNDNLLALFPQFNFEVINTIDYYIVEDEKHARRFLRKLDIKKNISKLTLFPLNKHTDPTEIPSFLDPAMEGKNIGIISEAGCPGIADPGADAVLVAHRRNLEVIPLIGPSSILLALMGSGLNGQNFAFNGYLSRDRKDRVKKLKDLEKKILNENQCQIFMDTPFRNVHLFEDVKRIINPEIRLCIATNLTCEDQSLRTKELKDWTSKQLDIHKKPTIFILG